MSKGGQKDGQQEVMKDFELGAQSASGFGALLKGEREKKGLSPEEVTQVTRVRSHYLVALENEDWQNLPSPVFVKGFIKAYAKALGLDEGKLLELYEIDAPSESAPSTTIIEPQKSKKGLLVVVLLFLVALTGIVAYLWSEDSAPELATTAMKKKISVESQAGPQEIIQKPALETTAPEFIKEPEKELEGIIEPQAGQIPPPPIAGLEGERAPEPQTEEKRAEAPTAVGDTSNQTDTPSTDIDWMVLGAIVKSNTWVRIEIDDQEAKEYNFKPGTRPQWKAKNSFTLLIGNAAGIELHLDGKEVGSLGRVGQVVKIRLPEDLPKISED